MANKTLIAVTIRRLAALALLGLCAVLAAGCNASSLPTTDTPTPPLPLASPTPTATSPPSTARVTTPTPWVPPTALAGTPIPGAEATLTAAPRLATRQITITNSQGEKVQMTLEVADTEPAQALGLMFRPSMPPDAGMLFDFGGDTGETFWMANTILPLSIAFIKADGTIIDIQDMQPLNTASVIPSGPYHYALETNQGFFRAHNISPGDRADLAGTAQAVSIPGMPDCAK